MKRRREIEKVSEIRSIIEELSMEQGVIAKSGVDDHNNAAHISIKPFLSFCNLVIQILDKIGPTMAVMRQDMHQNIQRLEKLQESDPSLYSNVVEILKKEATEGSARKVASCSRAFVWLTRSLDFTLALLQSLLKDVGVNMEQAVEEAYNISLKPWHGWISSAACKVGLKLVPDNKTFVRILMTKDEDHDTLKEEMQTLVSLLTPLLGDIHSILASSI
ncbi:hypothetical protein RJ640_030986 [Escallonia rubra]|uniref:Glycolipid transfer protein domain-containing protein n=1 Tax=Escallonia rubra TaxID=112253 RepID=A0AA88R9T5_9ASTE|nr:hypothetical protein RJ640_030986 [Escallonia rubra]